MGIVGVHGGGAADALQPHRVLIIHGG
jgi:hypothetical protein